MTVIDRILDSVDKIMRSKTFNILLSLGLIASSTVLTYELFKPPFHNDNTNNNNNTPPTNNTPPANSTQPLPRDVNPPKFVNYSIEKWRSGYITAWLNFTDETGVTNLDWLLYTNNTREIILNQANFSLDPELSKNKTLMQYLVVPVDPAAENYLDIKIFDVNKNSFTLWVSRDGVDVKPPEIKNVHLTSAGNAFFYQAQILDDKGVSAVDVQIKDESGHLLYSAIEAQSTTSKVITKQITDLLNLTDDLTIEFNITDGVNQFNKQSYSLQRILKSPELSLSSGMFANIRVDTANTYTNLSDIFNQFFKNLTEQGYNLEDILANSHISSVYSTNFLTDVNDLTLQAIINQANSSIGDYKDPSVFTSTDSYMKHTADEFLSWINVSGDRQETLTNGSVSDICYLITSFLYEKENYVLDDVWENGVLIDKEYDCKWYSSDFMNLYKCAKTQNSNLAFTVPIQLHNTDLGPFNGTGSHAYVGILGVNSDSHLVLAPVDPTEPFTPQPAPAQSSIDGYDDWHYVSVIPTDKMISLVQTYMNQHQTQNISGFPEFPIPPAQTIGNTSTRSYSMTTGPDQTIYFSTKDAKTRFFRTFNDLLFTRMFPELQKQIDYELGVHELKKLSDQGQLPFSVTSYLRNNPQYLITCAQEGIDLSFKEEN